MVEETRKLYKLQDNIAGDFTAVYNVEECYIDFGGPDDEDSLYLMNLPLSFSLTPTTPASEKKATIFQKIKSCILQRFLTKKEENVDIILVD